MVSPAYCFLLLWEISESEKKRGVTLRKVMTLGIVFIHMYIFAAYREGGGARPQSFFVEGVSEEKAVREKILFSTASE